MLDEVSLNVVAAALAVLLLALVLVVEWRRPAQRPVRVRRTKAEPDWERWETLIFNVQDIDERRRLRAWSRWLRQCIERERDASRHESRVVPLDLSPIPALVLRVRR